MPGGTASSGLGKYHGGTSQSQEAIEGKVAVRRQQHRAVCGECGARRIDSQLGLEPTIDEYIANMVGVFAEVRRVLRDDATLWLNMGDLFQDKQMVGLPWRLAFALQADGWYLRSDIIWAKKNPMPESVTDRPTKSHEYLFLLSKRPTYFYDADAIREAAEYGRREWSDADGNLASVGGGRGHATVGGANPEAGRNKRDVWTIATQPYPDAHFATFPEALVRPCILAGTSTRGCCSGCGAPWVQQIETSSHGDWNHRKTDDARVNSKPGGFPVDYERKQLGWQPSCECDADTKPATVLDPFAGSGTTGQVAHEEGREFIGVELNPEYAAMAKRRIEALQLQLAL